MTLTSAFHMYLYIHSINFCTNFLFRGLNSFFKMYCLSFHPAVVIRINFALAVKKVKVSQG